MNRFPAVRTMGATRAAVCVSAVRVAAGQRAIATVTPTTVGDVEADVVSALVEAGVEQDAAVTLAARLASSSAAAAAAAATEAAAAAVHPTTAATTGGVATLGSDQVVRLIQPELDRAAAQAEALVDAKVAAGKQRHPLPPLVVDPPPLLSPDFRSSFCFRHPAPVTCSPIRV